MLLDGSAAAVFLQLLRPHLAHVPALSLDLGHYSCGSLELSVRLLDQLQQMTNIVHLDLVASHDRSCTLDQ